MGPPDGVSAPASGVHPNVGYDYERDDEKWFKRVATSIEHPGIAATAAEWIPRFGLGRGKRFTRRRNKDEAGKLILRARSTPALEAGASMSLRSGLAQRSVRRLN